MPDIILLILFAFTNSRLARRKGLPPAVWVLVTIVTMIAGMFVGAIIVMLSYRGGLDMVSVQKFLLNNPLKVFTFYACEIGGGLLIRYILERRPDVDSNNM